MEGQRRRRVTGNLIAARVDEVMREMGWGARAVVLARIHLLAGRDRRFADLAEMEPTTISRIRHGEQICTDVELVALSVALRVNPLWLCGLSDVREPDPGLLRLADIDQEMGPD